MLELQDDSGRRFKVLVIEESHEGAAALPTPQGQRAPVGLPQSEGGHFPGFLQREFPANTQRGESVPSRFRIKSRRSTPKPKLNLTEV